MPVKEIVGQDRFLHKDEAIQQRHFLTLKPIKYLSLVFLIHKDLYR
jgi:hypothetical protein